MERVQRRPALSLVLSVALLVTLALPALDLRTGSAGVRTVPDSYASKRGFLALERELGVGTVDTVEIVVDGDARSTAVREGSSGSRRRSRATPRSAGRRRRSGRMTTSRWSRRSWPATAATRSSVQAIERLRTAVVPDAWPAPARAHT